MPQLKPISVKQARITVAGLNDIAFTSISGGKYAREEIKYNDGVNGIERTSAGMISIEPITLTKPHDPVNDKSITKFINDLQKSGNFVTVTVNPVNSDVAGTDLAGAASTTYTGCTLISYSPAKFDRNGNGLAMVEVMFAVSQMPTYS
jgi:hypothetical protein